MQPPPPPEPLYILRGHHAPVQCAAFSPGCSILAAGDGEGELKLWDLDSRRVTESIRAHESHSGILQVACPSGSSQHVISQGRDGVVKCWQIHSGSSINRDPVQVLSAGSYNFCRFALLQPRQTSSSCSIPAVAGNTPRSSLLPERAPVVKGFRPLASVARPPTPGNHSSFSNFEQTAETAARPAQQLPGKAKGLLLEQLVRLQHKQALSECVTGSVGPSIAGPSCVESSSSGLDLPGQPDLTEEAEENLVRGLSPLPSSVSSSAVGAAASGFATAHAARESVTSNASGLDTAPIAVAPAVAGDGTCLLALPTSDCADVGIWQLGAFGSTAGSGGMSGSSSSSSNDHVMLLKQRRSTERPSHGLCMAVALLQPQGCSLHALTGYEDGTVALWDTRRPACYLASVKLHTESIMCIAAAPNCKGGFSGSADDQLAAFAMHIPGGDIRLVQKLAMPKAGIADVAIRPDGRIAASAGWDGRIRIWHARKRQPLALLRWHSQQVACVSFSSDCRLLAAGGRDNHISMWSIYPPDST